jgi:16S rRNA processing protein RimM
VNTGSRSILSSGWLPLAHLLRPQGRRGELLAEPLSDLPELFAPGRELFLVAHSATAPETSPRADTPPLSTLLLEDHWFPTGKNAGRIVLKLSGCDSISAAEALAGKDLLIASTDLPTLDPDTFFVGDLVGCTLINTADSTGPTPVGTIVDLEFATGPDGRTRLEDAAPLLAVAPQPDADPVLIPFVRAWLDSVDIPSKRITMRLPEGFFDSPETSPDSPHS